MRLSRYQFHAKGPAASRSLSPSRAREGGDQTEHRSPLRGCLSRARQDSTFARTCVIATPRRDGRAEDVPQRRMHHGRHSSCDASPLAPLRPCGRERKRDVDLQEEVRFAATGDHPDWRGRENGDTSGNPSAFSYSGIPSYGSLRKGSQSPEHPGAGDQASPDFVHLPRAPRSGRDNFDKLDPRECASMPTTPAPARHGSASIHRPVGMTNPVAATER
jgi:hypothetical protein